MKRANASVDSLVAKLKGTGQKTWNYLEMKQMAEILARHRTKTKLAVREYRLLKQALAAETDAIEKLYLGYEGMFMRDHLRDALRLYVMINRDYHEALDTYMNGLKADKIVVAPAAKELETRRKAA